MAVGWGSDTAATQLTTVSTEQFFDSIISLDPNQFAHVQIISDASGTTDSLLIAVYSTLDVSSEVWDEQPVFELRAPNNSGNPLELSFFVEKVFKFRIGVRRSGTTDTFTADMNSRIATMS